MQQHPVPQQISSFEFKLIGDMTLKQFAYLAGGIVLGYIFFNLISYPLLRLLVSLLCAGAGFALAFLPVEERSLDRWMAAFLKSVLNPTLFVWKKAGVLPDYWDINFSPEKDAASFVKKTKAPIAEIMAYAISQQDVLEQNEKKFLEKIDLAYQQLIPSFLPISKTSGPQILPQNPAPPLATVFPLSKKTGASPKKQNIRGVVIPKMEKEKEASVKIVLAKTAQKQGLPKLSSTPGVITGYVKNSAGEFLKDIIIVIKDQKENTLRALKTNSVGQFATATPLDPGVYLMELDDPKKMYKFAIIELEVLDKILLPLEITAL